ncbi:MAG: hypothetical protein H0W12_00545 [Chitinophagaceae bacterium]|nr:hypothetical protein [Chitinophagaceae bacterium]
MITESSDKKELLTATEGVISQLQNLMSSINAHKINIIPYEDSWTAGQLFRRVIKSINGMSEAMKTKSKPADRGAGEKIADQKKHFLI